MDTIGRLTVTVLLIAWIVLVAEVAYQGVGHLWGFGGETSVLGVVVFCCLFFPSLAVAYVGMVKVWEDK